MTAGIVLVLGPLGCNLGAGMTGGLAYVPQEAADTLAFNDESVRLVQLEITEKRWLRRLLRNHVRFTGSPLAMKLLGDFALPLLRVEPVQPPCSIAETWAPVLQRLDQQEAAVPDLARILPSEEPLVM